MILGSLSLLICWSWQPQNGQMYTSISLSCFYTPLVLPELSFCERFGKEPAEEHMIASGLQHTKLHQTSSSFSAIYSCASMSCSVRATYSSPPNGLWRRVTSLLIRRVDLNRSQADCLRQGLKRCFGVHGKLAVGRKGSERELSLLRTKKASQCW